jgi:hypothetical protein
MARVIPIEDVRYTPAVAVLECGDDAPISFYVTEFERGEGTPLHLHPYPEVFLVERNTALFTAGDEELPPQPGHLPNGSRLSLPPSVLRPPTLQLPVSRESGREP